MEGSIRAGSLPAKGVLHWPSLVWGVLGYMLVADTQASIGLDATRVVYRAENREASLKVRNHGAQPILLQAWLDPDQTQAASQTPSVGLSRAGPQDLPMVVTPSLVRLPANGRQLLRVLYAGNGLPEDRESVVWLNVQEVPRQAESPAAGQSGILQIAVRQRIKVFFRPVGLPGRVQDAPGLVRWRLIGPERRLEITNPGAYHVSLLDLRLNGPGDALEVTDSLMVAPGQTLSVKLSRAPAREPLTLTFFNINDHGGHESYRASLVPDEVAVARPDTRPPR